MAAFMLGHSTIKVSKMASLDDPEEIVSKAADLARNNMLSQGQAETLLEALDANLCVLCVNRSEVVFCMECYKLIMSKLDRAKFERDMYHEENK
jgi:hypothetical protein